MKIFVRIILVLVASKMTSNNEPENDVKPAKDEPFYNGDLTAVCKASNY